MNNIELILIVIAAFSCVMAFVSLICTFKTKRRYEKLALKLGNGKDITEILKKYIDQVNELEKKDDEIIEYCNKLNNESMKSIKKIGLCKYDAFGNTKNKLSFALAMLNKENSGIIFSSIYGTDFSNIYVKKVENGKTKGNLSQEETQALEEAMRNSVI